MANGNSDINLPRAAERAARNLELLKQRSTLTDEKRLQRFEGFENVASAIKDVL